MRNAVRCKHHPDQLRMSQRTIANILPARALQMGHVEVHQPLPTQRVAQIDPFLLLHHFGPWSIEDGRDPLDVGPHPHRGFEPVTLLYAGSIRHHDSRGNTGYLQAGDVQWLTAGRGIIHSERATREFVRNGGTLEGIQLWVNLAPAHKMVQPRYQHLQEKVFPRHSFPGGAVLKVIAGTFAALEGPAQTYGNVQIWQLTLPAGATVDLPVPPASNFAAYLLDGELQTATGFNYRGKTLLNYRQDGTTVSLTGVAPLTRVLLLGGEPIGAPVTQHGPFVMNTQTEILEAMRDYQMGKMGFYVEEY